MRKFIISPEGLPYIIIGLVCTLLASIINIYLAVILMLLTLFIIYFFRNPPRRIETDENILLSPADGKVMDVKVLEHDDILKCKAYKLSIFLSLFSVHVNRVPMSGEIFYKKYIPGKFFPAFKSHASQFNERNIIGIRGNCLDLVVIQITGFVARRIVDWVKISEFVTQGDLFGLIKFGSSTEIIIPYDHVGIKVKPGDKVRGGKTVIGVIINETGNQ